MKPVSITIDDYTFEDLILEVKIIDRTIRGNYPDGLGFGPDKPLIRFSEEAPYLLALIQKVIELEAEVKRLKEFEFMYKGLCD